jgi:hypothetical protein
MVLVLDNLYLPFDHVISSFALPLDHQCSSSSLHEPTISFSFLVSSTISEIILWKMNLRKQIRFQLKIHYIIIKTTIQTNDKVEDMMAEVEVVKREHERAW